MYVAVASPMHTHIRAPSTITQIKDIFLACPVQYRARPFCPFPPHPQLICVRSGTQPNRQEGTYYSSILEVLREWCFTDSHLLSRATSLEGGRGAWTCTCIIVEGVDACMFSSEDPRE